MKHFVHRRDAGAWRPVSPSARRYAMLIIFVVSVVNFVDRSIVAILQEPIKADLGLSDAQVGALTGMAFGLVYGLFALPLGWVADRTSRKILLAVAVAFWSLMTGLSGLATSFLVIVVLRMGVAMGEAASVPVTHSLIADYYPVEKRARALSVWAVTISLGTLLSFVGGGWLERQFGWRGALGFIGLVGLVIAPFVATISQPRRGANDPTPREREERPGLVESFSTIWRKRSLRWLALAAIFNGYVLFANQFWTASFYIRTYELQISSAAWVSGLTVGIGGGLGAILGGVAAEQLARRDRRWYGWLPAVTVALAVPTGVAQFFAPSLGVSVAFGVLTMLLLNVFMPLAPTIHQSVVPPGLRGFTSALILVSSNIIGVGLGPLITGFISDLVMAKAGADSLRYAVTASFLFALLAAAAWFQVGRHLTQEMPSPQRH